MGGTTARGSGLMGASPRCTRQQGQNQSPSGTASRGGCRQLRCQPAVHCRPSTMPSQRSMFSSSRPPHPRQRWVKTASAPTSGMGRTAGEAAGLPPASPPVDFRGDGITPFVGVSEARGPLEERNLPCSASGFCFFGLPTSPDGDTNKKRKFSQLKILPRFCLSGLKTHRVGKNP